METMYVIVKRLKKNTEGGFGPGVTEKGSFREKPPQGSCSLPTRARSQGRKRKNL